jgi:hypothetical protein
MDPLEDKLKISRPIALLLLRAIGLNRRRGIAAVTTFALVLSPAASSISDGQQSSGCIGVCNSTIVGAAVGIGAAVATVAIIIAVNHDHHILKGCVFSGSNGPELQTSDAKTFALAGDAAGIKVGDRVKLHGSKAKKIKDSTGPAVFKVEKLDRDYGPCPVPPARAANSAQ